MSEKTEAMTPERIAEIKAREGKATPGPWVDETRHFEGIDGYGSETHPTVEANGKRLDVDTFIASWRENTKPKSISEIAKMKSFLGVENDI